MTVGPILKKKQSINFQSKSMDWFLYEKDIHHERVKLHSLPEKTNQIRPTVGRFI